MLYVSTFFYSLQSHRNRAVVQTLQITCSCHWFSKSNLASSPWKLDHLLQCAYCKGLYSPGITNHPCMFNTYDCWLFTCMPETSNIHLLSSQGYMFQTIIIIFSVKHQNIIAHGIGEQMPIWQLVMEACKVNKCHPMLKWLMQHQFCYVATSLKLEEILSEY